MIRTNANEEKNQVVYPTLIGCNIVRNWVEYGIDNNYIQTEIKKDIQTKRQTNRRHGYL